MVKHLEAVCFGLANGSLLALFTFGLVLIFKGTGSLNLAHGEIGTFAVIVAAVYLVPHGLPLGVILLVMVAIGAVVAVVLGRGLLRAVENGSEWSLVMATLAVAVLGRALAGLWWGNSPRFFPTLFGQGVIELGPVRITRQQAAIVVVTWTLLAGFSLLYKRTRLGVAMRAVAANRIGAAIVGARVGRLQSTMWMIGGAVAALTAFLAAPITFVTPGMMERFLLQSLAAATIAGMTSLPGAVVGSLIVGVLNEYANLYVPAGFREMVPLVVIAVALLARPQGLGTQRVGRTV